MFGVSEVKFPTYHSYNSNKKIPTTTRAQTDLSKTKFLSMLGNFRFPTFSKKKNSYSPYLNPIHAKIEDFRCPGNF